MSCDCIQDNTLWSEWEWRFLTSVVYVLLTKNCYQIIPCLSIRVKLTLERHVLSSMVQSLSRVRLFATPWMHAGFPVLHHRLDFVQNHVHWVGDAIQPPHPLSHPSPPAFSLSQHQGLFIGWPKDWSISVIPSNQYSPLGWTGWTSLQSKGLSRVSSNTTVQKHHSSVLSFLYSPTLTSIHDCWKNHSFD